MSRLAYADMPVARAALNEPGVKFQIRQQLMTTLLKLGSIDSIVGFAIDPDDGPFNDGALDEIDRDKIAIIRLTGYVTPLAKR